MILRSRRLAVALAVALTAGGATVAVAGPAQAVPIGCSPSFYHSYSVDPGVSITASYYMNCSTGEKPYPIAISKNGVEVATGAGTITYWCSGSTENDFAATGSGSFEAACG
jgi:hypothetical protein